MNEEYQKAKKALIKFYIQIKNTRKNLVNKKNIKIIKIGK